MAKAYFINSTPTNVKVQLNGGDLHKLAPISVSPSGNSISAPAWAAEIKAFKGPDVFGGDDNDNEVLFSSEQSGRTRRYSIKSTFSTTLDLYFFMFEDTIVGEAQTGASDKITIKLETTLQTEL